MTPRSQNVHAGVLREVGSRATPRENECDRRSFLLALGGLIVIPFVRRFFPSVDLSPHTNEWVVSWNEETVTGLYRQPVDDIITLLAQQNEILNDMVWMEGALPRHHTIIGRSGLPSNILRGL